MSPFNPIGNLLNGVNNTVIGAVTNDPTISGIGSEQLQAGKDQTVGTAVVLGTAAVLPVAAAGATEAATSGAAASLGTAVLTKAGAAASAVAAAAVKAKDAAADLYAKAGVLVDNVENAKGGFGEFLNYAIGFGKQVVADATHAPGYKLPATENGNKFLQAGGIMAASIAKLVNKLFN